MPCAEPLRGYISAAGGRVKFFKSTDPEFWIEPYQGLEIPCGYCILCRAEQARQWAVRISHEAQMHEENSFLTLTYDDQHLPPNGGLRYSDLQKFWKRLRKKYGKQSLRYYAVGEYGDRSLRPHYHAIVFGKAFTEGKIPVTDELWTTAALERDWGLGQVRVGNVTLGTASYCASYVTKKLAQKQKYVQPDEETGELIALEQPRAMMSKNIAREWWNKWGAFATAHDFVVIEGKKMKPPKAYDRWLGAQDERKLREIKERRIEKAEKIGKEQRRARARNAHAHAKRKSKKL